MVPFHINEKEHPLSSSLPINASESPSIDDEVATEANQSTIQYGTTWVAWLQVTSAMSINAACSIMWLSACSSPASISEWLQVSYTQLNWLSNVSAIITSILSLVTGWSYERFGIKANVI
jgi:hypothetical protein